MAKFATVVSGRLVAVFERAYGSFTAGDGRQMPGGITRWAHVVPEVGGQPVAVKIKDPELYVALNACFANEFGAHVSIECEVNGDAIAIDAEVIEAEEDPPAKRRNGREPVSA